MTGLKKCLCLILAIMTVSSFTVLAAETGDTQTSAQTSASAEDDGLPADTESGEPIQFSDVDYNSTLGKTIEKLVDKGVISGFPDGTFKSEQTLTRAEFSKIIVSFASADTAVNLDSGFPDVDNVGAEAHWAKPYIKVAKDLKIISGFPDGTFHPDEAVTYEQAVKMIMCSKGYTDYTYPDGFLQIALQKKLLAGNTHTGASSAAISRGSTAILINNAYSVSANNTNSSLVDIASGGTGKGSSSKSSGGGGGGGGGSSVWEKKINGVVWGNEYTMLDNSEDMTDTGEIAIKYTDSKTKEEKTETYRLATKYTKNAPGYLGKYVQATIRENDDGKEYIYELKVPENKNYSLQVKSEDFVSFTYNDAAGRYAMKYIVGNGYKEQEFNKDSENIYVIYNEKSICMTKPEDYRFDPSYVTGMKNGKIRAISNDSDKYCDIIFITDYKTGIVQSRNTQEKTIKLKYGAGEINASESGGREVSIVSSRGGNAVTVDKIKSGDVLDYASSLDGSVLDIIVSAAAETGNTVTGTVTKFTEEKISVKPTGASKAEEYELNSNYIDYYKNYEDSDKYYPTRDDKVKLYLNSFDLVAQIDQLTSTTDERYGYIADMDFASGKQTPEEDDSVRVKIHEINKSGTTVTGTKLMEIAKNVRVDGILYKDDPESVRESLRKAAAAANEGKVTNNSATDEAVFVRYEVESGKIALIDTLLDDKGAVSTESDERYNKLVRSTYVYNENDALGGKYKFYSSTPYSFYKSKLQDGFRVRANSTSTLWLFVPGKRTSDKNYKSGKFTTTNFHNGMEYYVEAYNVDSQRYAQFVLQYVTDGKEDVSAYSTQAVVTGINDETESIRISYMAYNTSTQTSKAVEDSSPAEEMLDSLNVGDVILFSENSSGEIHDFYKALDIEHLPVGRIDKEELLYSDASVNDRRIKGFDYYPDGAQRPTQKAARYRTLYGTAVKYDGSYLYVNPYLGTDYIDDPAGALTEALQLTSSSTKLFVYDESLASSTNTEKRFKAYTTLTQIRKVLNGKDDDTDFTTAEKNGGEFAGADQVFVYTYSSSSSSSTNPDVTVRFIYIIKRPSAQENPANYTGVDTPEEDAYKEERKAAINELKAHRSDETFTGGSNKTEYQEALAAGIAAISAAESPEEITNALNDAKAVIGEIIADNAMEAAIGEVEFYVSPDDYPEATAQIESIIAEAKAKLRAASKTSEINSAVEEAKAKIDELTDPLLIEYRAEAKDEIDAYLAGNSEAIDNTEELMAYIDEVKGNIDASNDPAGIKGYVSEAKAYIDNNIAAKALSEAKESTKAEIDAYIAENASEYLEDSDFSAICEDIYNQIALSESLEALEQIKSDAITNIEAFVQGKKAAGTEG